MIEGGPGRLSDPSAARLLTDVLRDVSRAFYLTMRILPSGCREPVGIAYLLARAADTIADTAAVPPAERLERLLAFRAALDANGPHAPAADGRRARGDGLEAIRPSGSEGLEGVTDGERRLLQRLPDLQRLYAALPASDRTHVHDVVTVLTQGMERDLRTFPPEGTGAIAALADASALDRYTWEVAGCVGIFWTTVTAAHTPALRHWDVARMSALGEQFGQGLQLVNVLRDLPRDLRNGRCYLPADELAAVGLAPRDLLDARATGALQPVVQRWTARARERLAAAQRYVLAIPRHCTRLRLAAVWPVLIGLATLRDMERAGAWLDGTRRVKVSRTWIYAMTTLSVPASFSNALLMRAFESLGGGYVSEKPTTEGVRESRNS